CILRELISSSQPRLCTSPALSNKEPNPVAHIVGTFNNKLLLVLVYQSKDPDKRERNKAKSNPTSKVRDFSQAKSGLMIFPAAQDRKSTRLNSSHVKISYAVFCLKK